MKMLDEVRYDIFRRVLAAQVTRGLSADITLGATENISRLALKRMEELGIVGDGYAKENKAPSMEFRSEEELPREYWKNKAECREAELGAAHLRAEIILKAKDEWADRAHKAEAEALEWKAQAEKAQQRAFDAIKAYGELALEMAQIKVRESTSGPHSSSLIETLRESRDFWKDRTRKESQLADNWKQRYDELAAELTAIKAAR